MPHTELINKLASMPSLKKAWKIVRSKAINSKSDSIAKSAIIFDTDSQQNLRNIQTSLKNDTFSFQGIYARLEDRGPSKSPRPIGVAPIQSRIVQRALLNLLWEKDKIQALVKGKDDKNSFGGIQNENTRSAIEEICRCVESGYNYYITTDIKNFFQNIKRSEVHDKIFNCLEDSSINLIIQKALECEIININNKDINKYKDLFPKGDVGVIQGCCLSPLYGNIYLSDFDYKMNSKYKNLRCIRYIDDLIIIGKNEKIVKRAFNIALNLLQSKGLEAYNFEEKETKAKFGDIRKKPIEFLGCSIAKGQIRPQKKAKKRLLGKIDEYIKENLISLQESQGNNEIKMSYVNTILKISNIIKGWGSAFAFCNDKLFFENIDKEIYNKISNFNNNYKNIIKKLGIIQKSRLLGLQLLIDCTEKDVIYGKNQSHTNYTNI